MLAYFAVLAMLAAPALAQDTAAAPAGVVIKTQLNELACLGISGGDTTAM